MITQSNTIDRVKIIRRIQFPSLNGLRFLAAFGVMIHHIEQAKYLYHLPNMWTNVAMSRLGEVCVWLFFVLSGFLITFLLLQETKTLGSINIQKFYMRRALRIWPLYLVIVLLGFVLLPAVAFYNVPTYPSVWDKVLWLKAALYAVFSPHVSEAYLPPIAYAGVLWSVGVEEWFYAIWPWLIKCTTRLQPLCLFLLAIIASLTVSRIICPTGHLGDLIGRLRFDSMAIGGLFALLVHVRHLRLAQSLLSTIFRIDAQLILYLLLGFALIEAWSFGAVDSIVYSVVFGTVILNLAVNTHSILNLETRPLRWLGDISYGLYCYNWVTSVSAILIVTYMFPHLHALGTNLAVSTLAVLLTIVAAGFSYEFIERRFLLLKERIFTRIPTLETTTIQTDVPEVAVFSLVKY